MKHLIQNRQLALAELANVFATAERTYAIPSRVLFRAVVFQDTERQFRLFLGRLIVGIDGPADTVSVTKAGPLRPIEVSGDVDDLSTVEGIAEFVSLWRPLLKVPASSTVLQSNVNIRREWSHGVRSTPPCWYFDLEYSDDESRTGNVPNGPFIDPNGTFFATDLGDAAAQWLDVPFFRQQGNPEKRIEVTLVDNRAYLGELTLDGPRLILQVHDRTRQPLYCTIITQDYHGVIRRQTLPVTGGELQTEIALPARSLEIYLTNDEGFCFDTYHESDHRHSRSHSLLSAVSRETEMQIELREALRSGENERVEFKKWLPIDRERPKSFELLSTVCAFANSLGGDLFIGVSDQLEIVGCGKGLTELTRVLKLSRDECRDPYAQLVRRAIAEGISPTVPVEISWLSHAGLDVLRVSVRRTGAVHHVVESNDTYVRRGANSTRATPPEIKALLDRVDEEQRGSGINGGSRAWVLGR